MSNVFGVIVAGRLVQSNFVQVGETEFLTEIVDANSINHVVVFLTGAQPFPEGTGGSVYMRWSDGTGDASNWHHLGFICNEKPSAIFKVAQLHQAAAQSVGVFAMGGGGGMCAGGAQLGVIVEPLATIMERCPAEGTKASQASSLAEFAEKMCSNVVHHCESFAKRLGGQDVVPLSAVHQWRDSFARRFQANPFFWRQLNNN